MQEVSRRNFLKGAGVVAAGAAVAGLAGCSTGQNEAGQAAVADDVQWDAETDYVIVGMGAAGLSAAVTCYDEGLGECIVL